MVQKIEISLPGDEVLRSHGTGRRWLYMVIGLTLAVTAWILIDNDNQPAQTQPYGYLINQVYIRNKVTEQINQFNDIVQSFKRNP
jgi:hypothetical protein